MAKKTIETPAGNFKAPSFKRKTMDVMSDDELIEAFIETKRVAGFVDPFQLNELEHRNLLLKLYNAYRGKR